MIFHRYSLHYDDIYFDKDYEAECDFIECLLNKYSITPVKHILDFGCGTGGHAIPLTERGYQVTGVDFSETMVGIAQKKAKDPGGQIRFQIGDIRDLSLKEKYDAVLAMFAVVSYQTKNEDLIATFKTARRHLAEGGLFLFDSWFGPAVLAIRPSERTKLIEEGNKQLIRIAKPELDILNHTVSVNYSLKHMQNNQVVDELHETHVMRYLFMPEIELICQITGFDLVNYCPFMIPGSLPSEADWNVTWIARAR